MSFETKATTTMMRINNERAYMDKTLNEIEPTLTGLTRQTKIVEETTKIWNRMQEDLKSLNQEMAALRESQMAVRGLMEGIAQHLENLAAKE